MPKPPKQPSHRTDRQLGVMLTADEKEAVAQVARQLGMSLSTAGRYLIKRGLNSHAKAFLEGEQPT